MNFADLRAAISTFFGAGCVAVYSPPETGPGDSTEFPNIERYAVRLFIPQGAVMARTTSGTVLVKNRSQPSEEARAQGFDVSEPRDSMFARLLRAEMISQHASGAVRSVHVTEHHETPSCKVEVVLPNGTAINRLYFLDEENTLQFLVLTP